MVSSMSTFFHFINYLTHGFQSAIALTIPAQYFPDYCHIFLMVPVLDTIQVYSGWLYLDQH